MSEAMTPDGIATLNEFITKFDASRDPDLWRKLVAEEAEELRQAGLNLIKEFADLAYVLCGLAAVAGEEAAEAELVRLDRELMAINPRLVDLLEVIEGVTGDAFLRVHASNMSKLGDDGKPLRREDGKILKGPNYKPPVLDDLLTS